MGRVIGFKVATTSISWVAVEGAKATPVYLGHDRIVTPKGDDPAELAGWAETVLAGVVDRLSPGVLVYRLAPPMGRLTHNQIFRVYYPLGILNLVAHRRGIPISHIAPQSIQPSAFGLPKGSDISAHITRLLGDHPPYWNADMLDAAATAIVRLG